MPTINRLRGEPATRLIATVPVDLVRRVDAAVKVRGGCRAEWVRKALESSLQRLERQQRRRTVSVEPSASHAA